MTEPVLPAESVAPSLILGDCVEVMTVMSSASLDAVVTDPPYGLAFMGKEWDRLSGQRWHEAWAMEALRVLKPGGYLLAFGGTRTYHHLVGAIENAGFEIRDSLHWFYGTGFPKSLDPAKKEPLIPEGLGTGLKPAHEPIVLARKPLIGTVAANILSHGTGALNIDACRIAAPNSLHDKGRWPTNVLLDEDAATELDTQSGIRPGCKSPSEAKPESKYRPSQGHYQQQGPIYGDTGGASRFFYTVKASAKERNLGLPAGAVNDHPTVKPVALMRWLVRLITPPGGIVLDPFVGSGTTGVAAISEGCRFVGIDENAEYLAIAQARLDAAGLTLPLEGVA